MAKVVWSEPALIDLRELLEYAADQSAEYAASLGEDLLAAADRLRFQAQSGWKVAEYDRESVREVFVRPYRLIYHLDGDACRIVAVIHASRDLIRVLEKRDP